MTGQGTLPESWQAGAFPLRSLEDALRAAHLAADQNRELVLISGPDAVFALGVGWFTGVAQILALEFPEQACRIILDCGDQAGSAQGALRAGLDVVFTGAPRAYQTLAEIAAARVRQIAGTRPPVLDLQPEPIL